jgi:hypothetical protein
VKCDHLCRGSRCSAGQPAAAMRRCALLLPLTHLCCRARAVAGRSG